MRKSATRGFTLVEVMVAFALFGVFALGMSSLIQFSMKGQKTVEKDTAVSNLTEEIRGLLGSVDACLNTFGTLTYNGSTAVSITTIKNANTPPASVYQVYTSGSSYIYEAMSVKITAMSLEPDPSIGNTPVLKISYDKTGESYGTPSKVRSIPMALTRNASNQIIACVALAKMTDNIWTRIPGTNWDIEYSGGKVGVGTMGVVYSQLDVAGSAGATNFYIRTPGTAATQQSQINLMTKDGGSGLETAPSLGWSIAAKGNAYSVAGSSPANSLIASYWDGTNWIPGITALKTGSVGLGTIVNPAVNLHVQGFSTAPSGVAIGIENTKPNGGSFLAFKTNNPSPNPFRGMVAKAQGTALGTPANDDWFIGNWGTPPRSISFWSADATYANFIERMRIDANGNLGVGTNNPTSRLEADSGTANAATLRLTGSATDTWAIIDNNNGAGIGWELISSGNGTTNPGGSGSFGIQRATNHVMGDMMAFSITRTGDVLLVPTSGRSVGIRTTSPAYPLDVNGNVRVSGNITATGTITASSDERLKKDFEPITGALDKILKMTGVFFKWKDGAKSPSRQVGFKAQEIEKILPEAVSSTVDGYKTVAYGNISAVLVEAIKEQQKMLKELQAENAELKEAVCQSQPEAKICKLKP